MPNSKIEEIEEYLVSNHRKFFWIGVLQSFTSLDLFNANDTCDNINFVNSILKIDEMHNNEISLIETHDYHSKTHEDVMRDISYCGRIHDLQFDGLENIVKGSFLGISIQVVCILFYIALLCFGIYEHLDTNFCVILFTFYPATYFLIVVILTTNRIEIANKILENNNG